MYVASIGRLHEEKKIVDRCRKHKVWLAVQGWKILVAKTGTGDRSECKFPSLYITQKSENKMNGRSEKLEGKKKTSLVRKSYAEYFACG